jgi:DNA-binding winged helix-turn-helix (wHTH) protein/Tol biopolymer transport system component
MGKRDKHFYEFDSFRIDVEERLLLREGRPVQLTPKAFDILLKLVESSGRVLEKDALMKEVWPDTFVEEANLVNNISLLRKVLGEDSTGGGYIQTVPRRGYRFVAGVKEFADEAAELIFEKHSRTSLLVEEDDWGLEEGTIVAVEGTLPAPAVSTGLLGAAQSARLLWPALAILGVMVGLVTGIFFGKRVWMAPSASFQRLTFRNGTLWTARFAPDGQTVYYGAAWGGSPSEIFTTRPESPESRPFGLANANILSLSSRGDMALLLNPRSWSLRIKGTLGVAPIAGGAPREILEDVEEADWSPDGKALAVIHWVNRRCRLEFPVGNLLYEAQPGGCIYDVRVSPKGDLVAFTDHPVWGDLLGEIAVVDLSGNKKALSGKWNSVFGLAWSPTGKELFFTGSQKASDCDLYATTLSGSQRLIAHAPGLIKIQDIANDGRILATRMAIQVPMIAFTLGDTRERDLTWLDSALVRDISSDGKLLLFDEEGGGGITPSGDATIYIRKTDGSPAIRLGEGDPIALSPDGKWVLVRNRYTSQLRLLPTGSGEPKMLSGDSITYAGTGNWFPDGKRLLLIGTEQGHGMRCYVYDLGSAQSRPVTSEGVSGTLVSPDGKYIIGGGPDMKWSVVPLEGGEPRLIAGLEEGERIIRWSGDGDAIYVNKFGELRPKVYRIDLSSGRREMCKEITPNDMTGATYVWRVVMTPDAKSYAYSYFRELSELYLVEGAK